MAVQVGNGLLHNWSQPKRQVCLTMHWYERVAAALRSKSVSNAEVGRALNMSGQAITLKLQGKRPVSVQELQVMVRMAGLTVPEALGDDAVVIELQDEMDLIELFRLMSAEQQKRFLATAKDAVAALRAADPSQP